MREVVWQPKFIFLVVIDCLRADHLGCYGYARPTSPTIDALAASGVRFERCYPQGIYTFPALVSMLTSIHHVAHGLENGDTLRYDVLTMPEYMKMADYLTAAFVSSSLVGGDLGFRKGFDEYDDRLNILCSGKNPFLWRSAEDTGQEIRNWLRHNKKSRCFVFAHFMDCHGPYVVPESYRNMFVGDGLYSRDEYLPIGNGHNSIPRQYSIDGDESVDFYISQYDAAIRYIDDQLATILGAFDKISSLEDGLVVITGDHGEAMGEHGVYFTHGKGLYEEFIRVPLIISGGPTSRKNIAMGQPVRHIDILPTLLDLLDIDDVPHYVQGSSLLPLVANFSSKTKSLDIFDVHRSSAYIIEKDWKYIVTGDTSLTDTPTSARGIGQFLRRCLSRTREELFDLATDPGETCNLVSRYRTITRYLRERVKVLHEEYRSVKLPVADLCPDDSPDSEEIRRRLQGLGYID